MCVMCLTQESEKTQTYVIIVNYVRIRVVSTSLTVWLRSDGLDIKFGILDFHHLHIL